jgi:hypothetical protein
VKPGMNPKLVAWLFAAIGGVFVQLSKVDHLSWQSAMDALLTVPDWHVGLAALGGAVVGTLKVGPGQIRVKDLPEEVRASLVPPAIAPPVVALATLIPPPPLGHEPAAGRDSEDH